jgi:hypothetical protein
MAGRFEYLPRPVPVEASEALRAFLDEELRSIADLINLHNPLWDDMRFPASAANPPGLASDPDYDTTNGGWLFDAVSTELLFFQAQMPHGWKEGTDIHPHVHWQKTTSAAGDVYWQLDYKKAPIAGVMDAAFTTLSTTSTVPGTPDNDTADEHLISAFDWIDMGGNEISDMFVFKLSRIGGNGADTYGADVRLLEFDIHYQINSQGSGREFIK